MSIKHQYLFIFILVVSIEYACQNTTTPTLMEANPPAVGFNVADSDEKAITIADKVMVAMGGRKNWDETKHISWNFFGNRKLFWDKSTGDVRIEIPKDDLTILMNIHNKTGKAKRGDKLYTTSDSLGFFLERGEGIWINDAYWLVMPFKLKDSGVTLKYIDMDTTQTGLMAHKLSLTFDKVGKTPQNKYHVYVDTTDYLVKQWDFYTNASDSLPRFSTPWQNYKQYNNILLSGDRGQRQLSDIKVESTVSTAIYTDF